MKSKALLLILGLALSGMLMPAEALAGTRYGVACYGAFNAGYLGTVYPRNLSQVRTTTSSTLIGHDSYAYAGENSSCTPFKIMGPNYLGAQANGYRDGAFCGGSSIRYNSTSATSISVTYLCSDISGTQQYRTGSTIRVWGGNTYGVFGALYSPSEPR